MSEIKLTITCSLCREKTETDVTIEDGWSVGGEEIYEEDGGLCPKHSIIEDFIANQCPGCVGGWGDCPLFKAFAYREESLSANDFATLENGTCPKRINGTFMAMRDTGIKEMDLSNSAPVESGRALAEAIRDYWEIFT